ncbi:hypothetical protein Zm00014a_030840 [Zea mays]|uniref:Uncharacterized protein n=1 Tax=Zea mays TaxID=4577 RepID=A0A3L6EUI1_MAIZE|nr:hypothetical protein Zm00014a_030840 [Zea mays]
MTLEQSFLPIPATSRSSFAPILNGTIQTKWSTANALKRIAILHSRTHFYLHLLSKVAKCSRVCWVLVIPELFGNQKTGLRMLRRETLVLTRALNTFSPLLSTSAMHRPRSSSRSNAAFRSRSSGSAAASSRGPAADVAACCLLADRRFARDIHRIRSATHQIRGMEDEEDLVVVTTACLGVADGALNLAGEDIQHGVASTSTRAVAAATESEDTPEKTAAEADATAAAASTTAAAMAAASEGRSAGGAGGGLAATARAEEATRGRSLAARRSARAADARRAGSSLRSAARASAWSAASATRASRKLPCASARRRKSSSRRSANGDGPRRRSGSCACGWCSRPESDASTRPSRAAASATASAEARDARRPTSARRSATSSSSWSTSGWNRHGRLADRAR